MAVTEILGTDSLSSSRITINTNFTTLEDEVSNITGYLDPTAQTLSGVDITGTSLTVSGASALNVTTASTITTTGDVDFGASVIKSGISGTVTSLTGTFSESMYLVDATNQVSLDNGVAGQEITLVFVSIGNNLDATNVAGATTITPQSANDTLTLRSDGSTWYIISSFGVQIS
tara:strand:+ start:604 stop:1125 length:522 start_codon:yes stop_codon:yes gene_type:complete